MRAVVEHELLKQQGFWKLYYVGPMFRKERPQAGRLRQFEQIGCEAVGSGEPAVDAESILLAARFFNEVGLPGVQVKINTIGCPNCRAVYRDGAPPTTGAAPRRNSAGLPSAVGPKRIPRLGLQEPGLQGEIARDAAADARSSRPGLPEAFRMRDGAPERAGLEFNVDEHLVRGFDYYTRTVFELSHSALGARDAVCGGGRYDNLVAELGGPPAGCVGFAVGVVPTILALQKTEDRRCAPAGRRRGCLSHRRQRRGPARTSSA